ncbi:MAG TPA: ABC transporter permease [Actinocatenispora sp.]
MTTLVLASVRRRLIAFLGSFLAVALTVALLSVSGLLLYSALTAGPGPDRFAAATLTVAQPRGLTLTTVKHQGDKVKTKSKTKPLTGAAALPPALAGRIARVDGVARAVPDFSFPADVVVAGRPARGPHGGPVVAHNWSAAASTPYRLADGGAPGRGQVVLDDTLGGHVRDTVRLTTRTGTHTYRVSGVTHGALANQAAVFLPDAAVPGVSGLTGPTAVAVFAAPGVTAGQLTDRVRPLAGTAHVYAGADRVRAEVPGSSVDYVGAVSVFGIMLGVTAFAAVFVLVGSVGLVVAGRLRELALLRTIGATPRQLRRLLAAETAAVGLVAGVIGAAAGGPLAGVVAGRFTAAGVLPAGFPVAVSPFVLAATVLVGVALSVLSARIAAGRATRIAPTQALRETAVAPPARTAVRVAAALLAAAGAVAVLAFTPLRSNMGIGMSFVACALLLSSAAAAGPVLVRLVGTALRPVAAATGVTGRLAAASVRASARRAASVAMPLMLLLGIVTTLLSVSTLTSQVAETQQARRAAPAAAQLVARGSGVPLAAARRLAATPGVRGAAATLPTTVLVDEGGKPAHYPAQGLLATGATALDLDVRAGRLALGGDGVAVGADLAAAHGWRIGDRVPVWLPDATRVTVRVVAVYRLTAGFGDLVLPAGLVAAHDPRGLVRTVYVTGRVPATPDLVAADATLPVRGVETQQAAFDALIVILVAFIAVSVVNTFAIATVARRREFADLRLAGATHRQVRRMVGTETALSVTVGVVLGCAVTAVVYGAFSVAQDGQWRWLADPGGYAGLLVGTVLLGMLAGIVPARLVVRRRALPADAR